MTRSGESLWRPVFRLVLAVGIAAFAMAALWRVWQKILVHGHSERSEESPLRHGDSSLRSE